MEAAGDTGSGTGAFEGTAQRYMSQKQMGPGYRRQEWLSQQQVIKLRAHRRGRVGRRRRSQQAAIGTVKRNELVPASPCPYCAASQLFCLMPLLPLWWQGVQHCAQWIVCRRRRWRRRPGAILQRLAHSAAIATRQVAGLVCLVAHARWLQRRMLLLLLLLGAAGLRERLQVYQGLAHPQHAVMLHCWRQAFERGGRVKISLAAKLTDAAQRLPSPLRISM